MDRLEAKFSDYIDDEHYDKIQQLLFDIIRDAYVSGYKAALEDSEKDNLRPFPSPDNRP